MFCYKLVIAPPNIHYSIVLNFSFTWICWLQLSLKGRSKLCSTLIIMYCWQRVMWANSSCRLVFSYLSLTQTCYHGDILHTLSLSWWYTAQIKFIILIKGRVIRNTSKHKSTQNGKNCITNPFGNISCILYEI